MAKKGLKKDCDILSDFCIFAARIQIKQA